MKLNLNAPVKIVHQPEVSTTVSAVNVLSISDLPAKKEIVAHLSDTTTPAVLWSGTDYDKVGTDWTAQIATRLTQVLATPKTTTT